MSAEPKHIAQLGVIARAVAADWALELGRPFHAAHSYVVSAGPDAVLKIVPPEDDESDLEADALAFWNGNGAVRLLRHDPRRKALLLERAVPGDDLSQMSEAEALAAAVDTGRRLWREPPTDAPFLNVLGLSRRWLEVVEPTEHEFVHYAQAALEAIKLKRRTLVHGDFHHHNILRRGPGWAAIDPKPALGEPEYDIAPFLWNPIVTEPTRQRTEERLAAFTAAGLDRDRMREWAIVRGTILGLPIYTGRVRPQLRVVSLLV
jgi:streptomycin 6-kinase